MLRIKIDVTEDILAALGYGPEYGVIHDVGLIAGDIEKILENHFANEPQVGDQIAEHGREVPKP